MKKIVFFIFIFVAFEFHTYSQSTAFNFTNGSLVNDSDNSISLSASDNNYHSVTDRDGEANSALKLNGSVLTSSHTPPQSIRSDFSISCWIKTSTNDNSERTIVEQYGGSIGGKGPLGYRIFLKDGKLKVEAKFVGYRWQNGIGNTYLLSDPADLSSTNVVNNNIWHHVVLSIEILGNQNMGNQGEQSVAEYKLYIDGQLNDDDINTTNSFFGSSHIWHLAPTEPLQIADDFSGSKSGYTDLIDDVRKYNEALDSDGVLDVFNERPNPIIIYVDDNASGNNDGTSWANAYNDISDALQNARINDDEIWVASGYYSPGDTRMDMYELKFPGIKIYGGFEGSESELSERDVYNNPSVISGDINGNDGNTLEYNDATRTDNNYTLMHVNTSQITIDGFVFEGGFSNETTNNFTRRGAAIFGSEISDNITIRNCTFRKNMALVEGAVRFKYTTPKDSARSLKIENCKFHDNLSRYGSGILVMTDGANASMNVEITGCLFYNNRVEDNGASKGLCGSAIAALANDQSELTVKVTNCTLYGNKDFGTSGKNDKAPIVLREYGTSGSVSTNTGNMHAEIYNSLFYKNFSSSGTFNPQPVGLMNFEQNKLSSLSFYNNNVNLSSFPFTLLDLLESKVQNGQLTIGLNLEQNPMFNDEMAGDFTLADMSTLKNEGDQNYLPAGYTKDLAGNNRVMDDSVDIGAYEIPAEMVTSTINIKTTSLLMYPNPARNIVNFRTSDFDKATLIDLNGRIVHVSENPSLLVDKIQSGIYIVIIETKKDQIYKEKLIIK